jgi:hydroxymethylglutaryl-CoA reductase (NADPH)
VGGGTHLTAQNTLLKFMGCSGTGGVAKLSKTIAGFALSLEISTLAAIVSGQFAKAHQKLGRNKPVNWLLRSEIDQHYISRHITNINPAGIGLISFNEGINIDNGLLTELTGKVSRKVIGFIPFSAEAEGEIKCIVIKSKPVDTEVIKGLHFMASNINTELADKLVQYRSCLEFTNSHYKEIEVYQYLHKNNFSNIPYFYGAHVDSAREIHLFMMAYLEPKKLLLFNSEDHPELWTRTIICNTIDSITGVHACYLTNNKDGLAHVSNFEPLAGLPFYLFMNSVNRNEYA